MHPTPDDPTTQHVRAACGGSRRSIEWLVVRLTPQLMSQALYYLRGLPGHHQAAEDMVQDVWAVTFLRLEDLAPRDGRMTPVLRSFLAETLRRKALNWLRRCATSQRDVNSLDHQSLDTLAADTRDVIREVLAREQTSALTTALDQLSPEDREILILRGMAGDPYGEIAAALGVEVGTVRMRYLRACERLRERLPPDMLDLNED